MDKAGEKVGQGNVRLDAARSRSVLDAKSALPVVFRLPSAWTARTVLPALAHLPGCLALESSQREARVGRYSFVAADPIRWLEPRPGDSPWGSARRLLNALFVPPIPELPPFQGGLAGFISFEYIREWERLPRAAHDPFQIPGYRFGLYDVVLAWDELTGESWLISQGWTGDKGVRSYDVARQRAEWFLQEIESRIFGECPLRENSLLRRDRKIFPAGYPCPDLPGVMSNFSREGYRSAVQRAIDYVWKGDVFQVNLAQHLWMKARSSPIDLYLRSATVNPSPFGGYFDAGKWQIISASPERLLSWRDGRVETRPIKGTRRRGLSDNEDRRLAAELSANAKEIAENTMIVDLMRNDLSRFCRDDSVVVSQWCGVEMFAHVMHLVSVVEGAAREGITPLDGLVCVVPGGSVSGAPKLRALEIIAELEPIARGAYCGSLGYLSAGGEADFNIMIRTLTASQGWWHFPVGGAIVADSDPDHEYDETWAKAAGMLSAVDIDDFAAR